MNIFTEIIIAVSAALGVFALIWVLSGAVQTPVKCGKNAKMWTVLSVRGSSPDLEQTIEGVLWLARRGTMKTDVIIVDMGMDEETAKIAGLLAGGNEKVTVCVRDDLETII